MNIIVASDSFKDALPAEEVCAAIARGWSQIMPEAEVIACPLADGGEGTARILTRASGGEWHVRTVEDPLGRPVKAGFGYQASTGTAYLDLAEASGIQHLSHALRNPFTTSTFGTGQLVREALKLGARTLYLGIGGSATHDLGMGIARALGIRWRNEKGSLLKGSGGQLQEVASIHTEENTFPEEAKLILLSDVRNPLCGSLGAARVYAPQKGAGPDAVDQLERGSMHLGRLIAAQFGDAWMDKQGAGAAGGVAVSLMAFFGATIAPGAEKIIELTGLDNHLPHADLLITGEGKLDHQSGQGKLLEAICRRAAAQRVPVMALCGQVDLSEGDVKSLGLRKAVSINEPGTPLAEAIAQTAERLSQAAAGLAREMI